jgi:multicomponent Na+:H+ antiporter subunit E
MSVTNARQILVPVGDSATIRETVAYVVRTATDGLADGDPSPSVHFVFPVSWQREDLHTEAAGEAEELLDRVETWVAEDLEEQDTTISVTTAIIGDDEFLFSPRDYADTLLDYAGEHDLDHIVLDPEYKPGARAPLITPLSAELELAAGITFEEAPVERQIRGRQLLRRAGDLNVFVTTFLLSFLFYQVIGGFAGTFDYVTGAISAGIVAFALSGISFERSIRPVRAATTLLRWLLYVPYLLWEITKANFQVAYIVLHPSLPIDPRMERIQPAVSVGLPVTTLANSITLTPGTVTVDVREREFRIHTLTQDARDDLYAGGLERAVRFVFFGRSGARIASPRERGQTPAPEPDEKSEASDDDRGDEQ